MKKNKNSMYYELGKHYHEDLIENLKGLVSINSVYDETTADENNPFGKGVTEALEYVSNLAKKDGFEVNNYKNMVVEILAGEGEKNITILAHADVVPAGSTGWKQEPFSVTECKGVLCGRGVADDKGPLLAAYYAMKLIVDNHLLGNYQIRFIVGGNEETGSRGVEYYFNELKKPAPTFGFSPDADYPLIYAEKGIINFNIEADIDIPGVNSIHGGVASNSVIEKCTINMVQNLLFTKWLKQNKIPFELEMKNDNSMDIIFRGVAAHGATPQAGVNAAMKAIHALYDYTGAESLERLIGLFDDVYGRGIGAFVTSEDMGDSSMNLGIFNYEKGKFNAIVNYRHCEGYEDSDLIKRVTDTVSPYKTSVLGISPLLYYPKDSILVSTLLKAYQEETGDLKSKPLAIGGGTYAKETVNTVAFGMEMPDWNSNMHSPGECIRKEDLYKSIGIYAHAIIDLGKKSNEN